MATILTFGPFRLDVDAGILFHGREPTTLGRRAVVLLALLAARAGEPGSKEALIDAAWPAQAIEDGNQTFQIAAVSSGFVHISAAANTLQLQQRRAYNYSGAELDTT